MDKEIIVETTFGRVKGKKDGRYYAFLGVPFGRAPEGKLRFKAPEFPDPWEDVFDATHYGPQSMQDGSFRVHAENNSEDCLNINIWTPGFDDGKKRPVVVQYSGGGSINGGNSNPVFSGEKFCKGRDVVYMFANFRLGMLGFLYLEHLLGPEYATSGSNGLLDQILALRWIRENAERFGGDPDNVTILGQSAGGMSVSNILMAPSARGLYRRAITMSGANQVVRDRETARVVTNRFLAVNGMKPEEAGRLLELPAREIVRMQQKYLWRFNHSLGPVYDGVALPPSNAEALPAGSMDGIDVLTGFCKEEFPCRPYDAQPTDEEVQRFMKIQFGTIWPRVFEVYQERRKEMPYYEAWSKLMTQYIFGDKTTRFAERLVGAGARVWDYRWDHPGRDGRPLHGSELRYVFGFLFDEEIKAPVTGEDVYMEKLANGTFMNFIETGDPRTPETPSWKAYQSGREGTRFYYDLYPTAEPFSLSQYDHEVPEEELRLDEKTEDTDPEHMAAAEVLQTLLQWG